MVFVQISPYASKHLSCSSEISRAFKRQSRSFNMSLPDYTFPHLVIFPVCSLGMWQVLLQANELILLRLPFPPGPNIWNLPTQLPLAPSSWSTNRPDSLLSKKKKIFPHYNLLSLSLQCLRPPPPHLDIPQLFFFHHLSDFVSDANIESSVPKVVVLPRLPYPHHVSCNRKHCPSSSTWNCPPSLLLWHYTQILSQPCWWLFFSPALSSLSSTLMYPNDHRKKRWQKDDGEVFKETEEELQNVQSHRSQEMSKF